MGAVYVPAHFAMTDAQTADVLARAGAADLVTQHADGLAATLLPFVYDPQQGEHGALLGHLARVNPQWSTATVGEALVLVRETDHYVSPSWLPSRTAHGRVVPTWDYVTVHVYGELSVHDDPQWTREVVRRLTERHEAGRPDGWSIEDPPAGYVEAMLRAVVGVQVRITRWMAKAKMAQNRSPADVAALADALGGAGQVDAATWVREHSLPAARRRAALSEHIAAGRGTPARR